MAKKSQRAVYEDSDDEVDQYLQQHESSPSSDDEMSTLSFGALKSAQDQLDEEEGKTRTKKSKKGSNRELKEKLKQEMKKATKKEVVPSDDDEDMSEGLFEEEDSDFDSDSPREQSSKGKKKSKHAPSEQSAKKRPSKVRKIPGLETPKESSLYKDIRFDAAFGKADLEKIRRDYKFLDEYREKEIKQIEMMLKDKKMLNKMTQKEVDDLEYQAKSLRNRLYSLQNRDKEKEVLKKYKQEKGIKGNFHLKKSDQKKILLKHKFENLKGKQKEKVIERKRKRRLGKEFRELEFNRPRDR